MKKIIAIMASAAALFLWSPVFAQSNFGREGHDGMNARSGQQAPKVDPETFLMETVGLTGEETKAVLPVYKEAREQKTEARKRVMKTRRALSAAMKENSVTGYMIRDYIAAKAELSAIEETYAEKYSQLLPPDKAAKLILSDERMQRRPGGQGAQGGQQRSRRPEGGAQRQGADFY